VLNLLSRNHVQEWDAIHTVKVTGLRTRVLKDSARRATLDQKGHLLTKHTSDFQNQLLPKTASVHQSAISARQRRREAQYVDGAKKCTELFRAAQIGMKELSRPIASILVPTLATQEYACI
jgi:hypothetical protein